MRKAIFVIAILILAFSARSQEVGYNTTDIGAAYQYSPDFNAFSLHLAMNAKIHHSFIIRGGYVNAGSQKTSLHTSESGSGWTAGIGYRYHFSVIPKRAFMGLGLGIQSVNINWSNTLLEGTTRLTLFQPSIEAGYTVVINDYFFITPSVSGIIQSKLNSKGQDVDYGNDFLPSAGISIGWRF